VVTGRALMLMAFAAFAAGCLSTPPSGVITCDNSCPISGFYCAGDGYCWANGEYPSLSSSTSTGGSSTGKTGTGGSSSGGAKASTGTTGR
jgi:hypothetical protein